ncbi:fimbrial protein [Morganella morganii]|nr:fimbrial protein [Morganella morganii]
MGYGPDNRGKFCEDAHKLPVEPVKCTFNNGADLDVQLGKLERTDIAVKSGTTTPVTKDIAIKCDGNIVYSANMKLEFTPISVSNEQVVSTSTTGLGVAVLYNGKAVQPGQTFPLSYQPGIHTLTLGFEAVRDPAVAATDLKTGDFTASAVLVFTEQ